MARKKDVETTVREIRRKTRKKYSAEEKIRIVLEGLRGEGTIAELCPREGIHPKKCNPCEPKMNNSSNSWQSCL